MSLLDSLSLDIIKNEKEMLRALRDSAERWYNELSEPFLPVLVGNAIFVSPQERQQLASLANKMLCAEHLINNGDALENKLKEIEVSLGIPLFSGRKDLRRRVEAYLDSGVFLKKFAYGSFKNAEDMAGCSETISAARLKWAVFRQNKDALVTQINRQLAKIG